MPTSRPPRGTAAVATSARQSQNVPPGGLRAPRGRWHSLNSLHETWPLLEIGGRQGGHFRHIASRI
jgi:hypothetical protein